MQSAKAAGVPQCFLHFFADGRDTAPRSATKYLAQIQDVMQQMNYGKLATVVGRYYAMDRDKRWERVKVAVEAMVQSTGEQSLDAVKTVEERYAKDETDEFLKPIILNGADARLKGLSILRRTSANFDHKK